MVFESLPLSLNLLFMGVFVVAGRMILKLLSPALFCALAMIPFVGAVVAYPFMVGLVLIIGSVGAFVEDRHWSRGVEFTLVGITAVVLIGWLAALSLRRPYYVDR